MDSYQKIKCVQGLIISLDEQLARVDGLISDRSNHAKACDDVIEKYKEAILEQLSDEEPKIETEC